jgi:hypothetical protein
MLIIFPSWIKQFYRELYRVLQQSERKEVILDHKCPEGVNAIASSPRKKLDCNISKLAYNKYYSYSATVSGQCELDSHADTCVAGTNCVVIEDTEQTVNVSAFTDKHKTLNNIPIVTAATAYDDERTRVTYILVLGQTIYMGDTMPNTLLCPNQLRKYGLVVNNCPRHLAPPNNPSSHSIICSDKGQ